MKRNDLMKEQSRSRLPPIANPPRLITFDEFKKDTKGKKRGVKRMKSCKIEQKTNVVLIDFITLKINVRKLVNRKLVEKRYVYYDGENRIIIKKYIQFLDNLTGKEFYEWVNKSENKIIYFDKNYTQKFYEWVLVKLKNNMGKNINDKFIVFLILEIILFY